jgi:putative endonuclease
MYFVYILVSEDRQHWYIGLTNNLERRIAEHNAEKSTHTRKFGPWNIQTYIAFHERSRAEEFEKYLKSHSGRAFTKKHL